MTNDDEARPPNDEIAKSGTRPVAVFNGSGGLQVAVWKNKSESGHDYYSVRIDRNYKDSNEQFQSTQYLRDGDLLRAQKLLGEADDWIEQNRNKHRSASSPSR